mmetsp:Transcript_16629/g.36199  ORF Transcript_16629/g.36199 Transcript_16629/m.36199 type:complete len:211 (-) Transcript_16629:207-839(-)
MLAKAFIASEPISDTLAVFSPTEISVLSSLPNTFFSKETDRGVSLDRAVPGPGSMMDAFNARSTTAPFPKTRDAARAISSGLLCSVSRRGRCKLPVPVTRGEPRAASFFTSSTTSTSISLTIRCTVIPNAIDAPILVPSILFGCLYRYMLSSCAFRAISSSLSRRRCSASSRSFSTRCSWYFSLAQYRPAATAVVPITARLAIFSLLTDC